MAKGVKRQQGSHSAARQVSSTITREADELQAVQQIPPPTATKVQGMGNCKITKSTLLMVAICMEERVVIWTPFCFYFKLE